MPPAPHVPQLTDLINSGKSQINVHIGGGVPATVPMRGPQGARALRLRTRKRKDLRVLRGKHDSVLLPEGGGRWSAFHSIDVVGELID